MYKREFRVDFSKIYFKKVRTNIQRGQVVNLDQNQTPKYKTMHLQWLRGSLVGQRVVFKRRLKKRFLDIGFILIESILSFWRIFKVSDVLGWFRFWEIKIC